MVNMDYKTYQKETFEKVNVFDRTFKPWEKWQDVKLTNICPCSTCDTYKDYEIKAILGSIGERQYAKLPDTCPCIDKLQWEMDCFAKLQWYEDNDERLKHEK